MENFIEMSSGFFLINTENSLEINLRIYLCYVETFFNNSYPIQNIIFKAVIKSHLYFIANRFVMSQLMDKNIIIKKKSFDIFSKELVRENY